MSFENSDAILQALLVTIIQVMLPIVLGALGLLIKAAIEKIKLSMTTDQLQLASDLAAQLVLAAEQSGLSGALASEGQAKKEWAINRLQSQLESKGIRLELHVLSDLIESAVYAQINALK